MGCVSVVNGMGEWALNLFSMTFNLRHDYAIVERKSWSNGVEVECHISFTPHHHV